ncbi:unnamed protein product [Brugia timori]|uniref:Uncharacterized protein n=1 Tax=Brugia timori TaxID=42155 RepID=A0A0R3Q8H0_9BILA|nr:unnamed protein product [Brugia timori]
MHVALLQFDFYNFEISLGIIILLNNSYKSCQLLYLQVVLFFTSEIV